MRDSRASPVVPVPPNVRRRFFPWDRPLLPQLVAWLAEGWSQGGPLDLAGTLAVVPTHQAGRRLREALAIHAGAEGQAVFPPRVVTPDGLLTEPLQRPELADRLQTTLAWSSVLRGADMGDFRDLFPIDPPTRSFGWSVRLGQQLAALQATLAEAGWRLKDVPAALKGSGSGNSLPEAERWRQLAALESRCDEALAAAGLRDSQAAKIAAADRPQLPPGICRVVVLATPDPWPLALRALVAIASSLPVEIAVFAALEEADGFDGWGRPLPEAWSRRALELPDFAGCVHVCADPVAQAESIAAWAAGRGETAGWFAIGAADPETLAPLATALERRGLAAFNPAGNLRRTDGLYALLAALADLAKEPSFAAVEALGRCPDFIEALRHSLGAAFSPSRWLAGLDDLRAKHLPPDLATAQQHSAAPAELLSGLKAAAELRATLTAEPFARAATAGLAGLFPGRALEARIAADPLFEAATADWMAVLRDCAAAAKLVDLPLGEWWDLALSLYGDLRRTEEKPAGAVELQGWLELLWEDAPHLAIAGCNDGRLPEATEADPFLPQALCRRLGLKTNEGRLVRDAYLLQALARSRRRDGRLDLLFGRQSAAGDPLRPSRLLLFCPDQELPARIGLLFRPAPAGPSQAGWTRAWRLKPRPAGAPGPGGEGAAAWLPAPTAVAVTALGAWLECPFRFYLRHVLKMEPVDPEKCELSAADFGTLCHHALEAMAREEALRECLDPAALREFLLGELDRLARARFGTEPSLPLVIQLEAARQRMRRVAELEAAERAAGWRIEKIEHPISLAIGGLTVRARVDRIDRNARTGAVRILDYKTADSATEPAAKHFHRRSRSDSPPEAAVFEWEGKPHVWTDLQLPLYRAALAAEYPEIAASGYFNLPKAAADSKLCWWDPYPPALQAAALACAERVCAAIRAGIFWPPNESKRLETDDFAPLFHRGVAASVDWEGNR